MCGKPVFYRSKFTWKPSAVDDQFLYSAGQAVYGNARYGGVALALPV